MINFLKKILNRHRELNIFYLRALIHFLKFLLSSSFRKSRCIVDPPSEFFYKYRKTVNYFSIPLNIVGKIFIKKKIFISVNNNCNFSIGHIFREINELKRIQNLDKKYKDSVILFVSSRKEILSDTKVVFEDKNFKILFGGVKRLLLTFIAIKCPSISIDASLSSDNYIFSDKILSNRIIFNNKSKKRAKMASKSQEFFPFKAKLNNFENKKKQILEKLNIKNKFIVIQIKTEISNSTFKILNPKTYLDTINYFKLKGYDIVFAGREICPQIFLDNNIINYANSKYASPFNDYLLVGYSTLVISSGSGFCNIAETLDKPILIINSYHGIQQFSRRTILLPTILSLNGKLIDPKIQHKYLCTFGQNFGQLNSEKFNLGYMASNEDILHSAKELEQMITLPLPALTPLQKKIRNSNNFPLLSDGLSRISDYYLAKHDIF